MPLSTARLSKVLLALTALAPATVRVGAQSAASGGESSASLENARRDLQTLPANSGALDQTKDPALKFSIPTAPSGSSGDKKTSSAPNSLLDPAAPSGEWLLDAWRKAEVESQTRRAAEASRNAAFERSPDKAKADAQNPFTPYLQQWISPRDQGLLQLKGPNDLYGSTPGLPVNGETRTSAEPLPTGFMANDSAQVAAKNAQSNPAGPAPNPYLAGTDTKVAPGFSSVGAGQLPASSSFSPAQPTEPTHLSSSGGSSVTASKSSKPVAHLAEPGYLPPTAPIIDDRKYFPQLHRF